ILLLLILNLNISSVPQLALNPRLSEKLSRTIKMIEASTTQEATRSRFMELPAELRIRIYHELVPTIVASRDYIFLRATCQTIRNELDHEILRCWKHHTSDALTRVKALSPIFESIRIEALEDSTHGSLSTVKISLSRDILNYTTGHANKQSISRDQWTTDIEHLVGVFTIDLAPLDHVIFIIDGGPRFIASTTSVNDHSQYRKWWMAAVFFRIIQQAMEKNGHLSSMLLDRIGVNHVTVLWENESLTVHGINAHSVRLQAQRLSYSRVVPISDADRNVTGFHWAKIMKEV
ncbi:hypothetical protein B0J11DRAFT_606387, partial [Dendryphion nanum]